MSNTGTADATNMSYPAAPAKFAKSGTCANGTLAKNASCTVVFTYTPTAVATDNATYTITGGGASIPIALSGTGVAAGAPSISASPTSLPFGNVTVNTTSAAQTITVSNTGTADATNMSYPAAPAEFAKSGTCVNGTLAKNASCTVVFTYTPTAVATDNATYTITGGGASIPIALSGTGVAAGAPSISASPPSLAFGNVTVNTTSARRPSPCPTPARRRDQHELPGGPAKFAKSGTCAGATLAKNASCTVMFTYTPTAVAADNATYTITGGGASIPIALSGAGVAVGAPSVSASPTSLPFGNVTVNTPSAPQTITVSNTGGADATNMSYPAAPAKFAKSGTCAGATLAKNTSCTVVFTYTPTAVAADNATYTITGGGASIPIALSGAGVNAGAASLSASPASLAFGNVASGATSPTQSVTVTNTGGTAATGVGLANSNAAEFVVSGNTCGATLAAGASCGFDVAYKPSAVGSDNATLTINSSAAPVSLALSGTGTAAATANLTVSPATLAFGTVTLGTTAPAKSLTVTNSGGAAANGVAFANSNAAEFPVSGNTCGASIAAGASCTLSVAYAPGAAGADNDTLTISYTGGSNLTVGLTGTGTAAPTSNLQATPATVAFGNVTVGQTSAATTITINNSGGAAATTVALANSNAAEFIVSSNTCGATIGNGGSCTLKVAYAPGAAGADNATLTLTYAGGGALSIALSGTGVAGTPPPPGAGQLSFPAADTFADQNAGTSSAGHTIAVSNIGGAAVVVSGITSSNPGEFTVSASNCGTVNAGSACSFTLTFTPSAAGGRSATITIASNGVGSPQTLTATGTGVGSAPPPPPAGTTATAIEYYHAGFDHYFMTHIADEITKLDNGTFVGWTRTGKSFKVHASAAAGLSAVCRFFSTAFGVKSSHFYTPNAPECGVVKASPAWTFEAEVFHVLYPEFDGSCPANTVPVYRMYNDGQGGAPNHRYTTEMAVRNAMLALGWIAEGAGTIGVIMCSPQ